MPSQLAVYVTAPPTPSSGRGRPAYIDFGAGIAVLNTGHLHRACGRRQPAAGPLQSHLLHVTPYESAVALAEKLNALAPGTTPKKTLFVTTGAEAVENA